MFACIHARSVPKFENDAVNPLVTLAEPILALLREGKPARLYKPADREEAKRVRALQLLTSKPVMYILNVDEGSAATGNALSETAMKMAKEKGADAVIISAKIESEIAEMKSSGACV